MTGRVLIGVAQVVVIGLVPVAIVATIAHASLLLAHGRRLGQRLHLLPPEPPTPFGPEFEHLVETLRRLGPRVRHPSHGAAATRQRGIVAAYDQALVDLAVALDIETDLDELADGFDHDVERMRIEDALQAAGVLWRTRLP